MIVYLGALSYDKGVEQAIDFAKRLLAEAFPEKFDLREIRIKEGMPTLGEAMDHLKKAIAFYKKNGKRFLLVIHGYGSTGKGGAICRSARSFLVAQQKKGVIKRVVFGENMTIFNQDAREIKAICPALNAYMEKCNHGITVLEI